MTVHVKKFLTDAATAHFLLPTLQLQITVLRFIAENFTSF